MSGDAAKPLASYRSGSVSVALFPKGTVSLRRSYKAKDGAWQNTHTLWERDLPHAIAALADCLINSWQESQSLEERDFPRAIKTLAECLISNATPSVDGTDEK